VYGRCNGRFSAGDLVPFSPIEAVFDLPGLERRVQARWDELDVVRAALSRNAEGPVFAFYDGPLTVNGRPGIHHVVAQGFKDVIPRYRTMKGYRVPRTAGWDCHGIPVELEIERSLGFTSKKDIEAYGVARFNELCRAFVMRYIGEFEDLTRRIGYWVDTANAYWTLHDGYIDSVWWSLKTLYDSGLMYEDSRVSPYCPRCGTTLSDQEVAQGYQDVVDESVFVRLPLLTGPLGATADRPGADLLVWTTMPWTFLATTAAVIGPGLKYVLADGGRADDRPVLVAEALVERALGNGARVLRPVEHSELVGARYRGPFDYVGPGSASDPDGDPGAWRVVVEGDFVTIEQGSGIVSTGAAFGEDDMATARANGLPVVNPVTLDGRFDNRCGPFAGLRVRDADPVVIERLRADGLLLATEPYEHSYPFCRHCDTPLIYYAKPSWYLATSRLTSRMLEDNEHVAWQPQHIRTGRYGDWLAVTVDWAVSRERYWGTPLPLWRCVECRHVTAIGSRAELARRVGVDVATIDAHRPGIDEITMPCDECGGSSERVSDVIDAWYDSGAMPFARHGYPHRPRSAEIFRAGFPADFICEGIDQTRGWFYSLQAVSTLLFETNAYRHAQCLGHIVDTAGKKMSKSAGNVIDPWALIDTHGADALRWMLIIDGNPWQPHLISDSAVATSSRRSLLTLWHVYSFFMTYARQARWQPHCDPVSDPRPVLDRYILGELRQLISDVDDAYRSFDATGAGRHLATFIDTLSNWYLRLSRNRFSRLDDQRADAAFDTLWRVLATLTYLLAPITPFLADALYENLVLGVNASAAVSVHLADFPEAAEVPAPDPAEAQRLREAIADARRLVTLGRNARQSAGCPTRQPLTRAALIVPAARRSHYPVVAELVASELNVEHCELIDSSHPAIDRRLHPNFRALGRQFGKHTATVAAALGQLDTGAAAAQLRDGGRLRLTGMPGLSDVEVSADMVSVTEEPAPGWSQAAEGGYAVMLDLSVDDRLRRKGLARELVRLINELRKSAGLDVTEPAGLTVQILEDPDGMLQATLVEAQGDMLRGVRATLASTAPSGSAERVAELAGGRVSLAVWRS
jgi:isoleucyl-tRNA synthetase